MCFYGKWEGRGLLARRRVQNFEGDDGLRWLARLKERAGATWYSLYWLLFLHCAWWIVETVGR
jgi:hypothetical protein